MKTRFVFFAAVSFLFIACSGENESVKIIDQPDTTKQVYTGNTLEISWADIEADSGINGDVLILKGYIGDLGEYVEQRHNKMTVPLFERRNQRAGFHVNLNVKIGTRPNHVHELPAEFLPEDFKIVPDENKGNFITRGTYVSVTAVKAEPTKQGRIYANLDRIVISEAPGFSASQSGAVRFTSELLRDTSKKTVYGFVDGNIQLPEEILPYTNEIILDLKNSSVAEIRTVSIPLGDSPGMMQDLPDNYTEADLFIRDHTGSKIPYGSKVRIYGVWEHSTADPTSPGKFYLEEIQVIQILKNTPAL